MGQAIHEGVQDEGPPLGVQLLEAAVQRGALGAAEQAGQRIGVFVLLLGNLEAGHFAHAVAHQIERAVADDAGQPRLARAAHRIEPVGVLPDADEGVVHRVGRERGLPGDAQRERIEPAGLQVVQLPERRAITAGAALEQGGDMLAGQIGGGFAQNDLIGFRRTIARGRQREQETRPARVAGHHASVTCGTASRMQRRGRSAGRSRPGSCGSCPPHRPRPRSCCSRCPRRARAGWSAAARRAA